MLSHEEQEKIFALLNDNVPLSQISRLLGRSIGSIYKYKKHYQQNDSPVGKEKKVSSKILPFEGDISLRLRRGEKSVKRIFFSLEKAGYTGSYQLLNSYIREHIASVDRKKYKRSVRVETEPGEQAQVDWGSFGTVIIDGRKEKLYAFVYVLSYSRATYFEFVVKQNQHVLQNCHIHAFEKLGIPQTIRYDNMKTVVLGRTRMKNGERKVDWNVAFQNFAKYYGFEPVVCPPYWPRAKGKVEAAVKYIKHNFAEKNLFKKNFSTLEQLNIEVANWTENIANERLHATTKQKPRERWQMEKDFLVFPKENEFNSTPLLHRRSTKDGLIQYKSTFYSVPMEYAQKKLFLREIVNRGIPILKIYDKHLCVGEHKISTKRGEWIIDNAHTLKHEEEKQSKKNTSKKETQKRASIKVAVRDLTYYNITI